ncbi:MAG TPA: cystathionine beta-lyase [Lachnospiraceae bacterium]|nr:cystathionine beta-lyase [Lachnospiraceae bacterium]
MARDFDTIIDRRNTGSEKWDVKENELPMWVADMDFETAPEIIEALQKRVSHGVFGYTGITDDWYDAYISWWRRRHSLEIQRESLIFTTGVVPAISSLVRKLTTPAEKVLVQTPVYNIFFNSILNNGRVPLESPLILRNNRYEMDFERLEQDLSDPQTTLMLLCNPQNPGGRVWTKVELQEVARLCKKHGVTVLSDEIHCDLARCGVSYVPFASVSDTAASISVTCVSPSKAFNLAGLHSAAVIVPDEHLRNRVNRALNTDEVAEPNAFAICGAAAAWNEGEAWLDELRAYLDENDRTARAFLAENLPEVTAIGEDATYLLWIDTRDLPEHGRGLAAFLRDCNGLYLSDGAQYGKAGQGFVRLNFACPRPVLMDGLARFRDGVRAFERVKRS